jgi:hypothetical protein
LGGIFLKGATEGKIGQGDDSLPHICTSATYLRPYCSAVS